MNSMAIGTIAFACLFGGTMLGMFLRFILPDHHLSSESRDALRLVMTTLSLMSALVVGLLIASSKSAFDTRDAEYRRSAANLVLLDRAMAHYGPETKEARDLLRRIAESRLCRLWPEDCTTRAENSRADIGAGIEQIEDMLRALTPKNDAQRWLQSRALQISADTEQMRFLVMEQAGSTIQWPFLALLVFWLTIIFVSFGLSAPRNATVIAVYFVCSLSIAGAIYLILGMDQPFEAPIKISSAPLRAAIDQLGR
jgi:hypothetical protein